jgi:hypothetical protein
MFALLSIVFFGANNAPRAILKGFMADWECRRSLTVDMFWQSYLQIYHLNPQRIRQDNKKNVRMQIPILPEEASLP